MHVEECSHQISAQLDGFLIDSKITSNRSQTGHGFREHGPVGPPSRAKQPPQVLGGISTFHAYK